MLGRTGTPHLTHLAIMVVDDRGGDDVDQGDDDVDQGDDGDGDRGERETQFAWR